MNSFSEGQVILIDKPYKWTSFDAVNKIKYLIKKYQVSITNQQSTIDSQQSTVNSQQSTIDSQQSPIDNQQIKKSANQKIKIGHAGTLDPLATGLLIICTGKFTKRIEEFQAQEKEYTGTFFLGATTPCFDLEQPIDKQFPIDHITDEAIQLATKNFIGEIQQIPPIFSAVKIKGKRAYDMARNGEEPEIKARTINIKVFEITRIALPEVDFKIVCSKGTYIRSIARDFGIALGSGAHLTALCRTRIGNFLLANAQSVQAFELNLLAELDKGSL